MYILITEDPTDFEAVKVIIRRIAEKPNLPISGKGFNGAGEIKNKGAATIEALLRPETRGCIVVRDCDGLDSEGKFKSIKADVFDKIKYKEKYQFCVVLPKHELEAWFLADIKCVTKVWPQWKPEKEYHQPETISKAKEELMKISRTHNLKPRYATSDGAQIASKLDLEVVRRKCPSIEPLYRLVQGNKGNL